MEKSRKLEVDREAEKSDKEALENAQERQDKKQESNEADKTYDSDHVDLSRDR